ASGGHARVSAGTGGVSELLAPLAWLGPNARAVLPQLEHWRAEHGLSRKLRLDLDRALQVIRGPADGVPSCCGGLPEGGNISIRTSSARFESKSIDSIVLQDQDGELLKFVEFFSRSPSL